MNREIKPLTGLRGVLALWVVSTHWLSADLTGLPGAITGHGYIAVDLFMLLSGFVLALTYEPRMQRDVWRGHGGFVWQRICRLWPLYAVTSLVCLAGDWADGDWPFTPDSGGVVPAVASNLLMLMTHIWEVDALNGPAWSISVEFTLNLAFPLFILLGARLPRRAAILVAIAYGAMMLASSVLHSWLNDGPVGALTTLDSRLMYLRCGPEFGLGVLCWRLWRDGAWNRMLGANATQAALAVALLAMTPFKGSDLLFFALGSLLVIGLATGRGWVAGLLAMRVPHWLGVISFSVYLWHTPVVLMRPLLLRLLPGGGMPAMMAANAINLVLVLALSTLSYHWLEVPARLWLRGLVKPATSGQPPGLRPRPG